MENSIYLNDPQGSTLLAPEHGAAILCSDTNENYCVTGSADHGLRVYALSNGKQAKQLFYKNYGHTEWVTAVAMLDDGRVVSGGMDSQLCLWDRSWARCKSSLCHKGSIAKILVDNQNICLSCAYDSSVQITNLDSFTQVGLLKGIHKGPVSNIAWQNSLVVSGGRDGTVAFWDINNEKCVYKAPLHSSAVSNIAFCDEDGSSVILTGGSSDGKVVCIDMRTTDPVFQTRLHGGSINVMQQIGDGLLLTASADKNIVVSDLRDRANVISSGQTSDSVMCGEVVDGALIVGCADGNVLSYNIETMECAWGFGADNRGAVHTLSVAHKRQKVIAGGDCAQGIMLNF